MLAHPFLSLTLMSPIARVALVVMALSLALLLVAGGADGILLCSTGGGFPRR